MKQFIQLTSFLLILLITSIINAQEKETGSKLNFYGNFRFRAELDRNSDKTDGSTRDDRDRLRYRLRFGFKYSLNKNIEFGGRLRSGNSLNQQSPHVTLGKEFQSDDFSIDKAYLKVSNRKGYWAWAGKNGMPFWQQNELIWDDDVNPEGIAVGGNYKLSEKLNLEPVVGYFIVSNAGKTFNDDSSISIVQLKLNSNLGNNNITISNGLISGSDIPNTPDETDTFAMNYNILATSFQINLMKTGLKIGLDYFENLKNYKTNTQIDDVYKNQTSGYVGSLMYSFKKFKFSYYYAHIEKYAVIDYFSQDDWVRWGNNNMTRSSNFRGHELRVSYKFNAKFNTVLRTYFVEGIKTTRTNLETGTRIRLDFNIKF